MHTMKSGGDASGLLVVLQREFKTGQQELVNGAAGSE